MRKHVTYIKEVLGETALAATTASEETICEQLDSVRYSVFQTNSAGFTGELKIQWKDDLTDWEDLPISTMALAADDIIIVDAETNFKHIRAKVEVAAGTADFQIYVKGKTIGA